MLPFSWRGLITIQLRSSVWVEAAAPDTHFQPFRFPGLLKRSDENGVGGGGEWGVCGDLFPNRKYCVNADTLCPLSQTELFQQPQKLLLSDKTNDNGRSNNYRITKPSVFTSLSCGMGSVFWQLNCKNITFPCSNKNNLILH